MVSRIGSQWVSWSGNFFISAEMWFTLNENVSCQNDRYWCCENPHAVHDFPCITLNFEPGVQ